MKNTNLKIIALILALLCLLSSCTAGNNNAEETTKAPETENTLSSAPETEYEEEIDETETETETETQPAEVLIGDQSENENYKQITARDIHQYKYIHFFTEKTGEVLCLEVSSEWTVKKVTSSTYTISRDGNEIGNVFIGQSSDFNEWQTVSKEESDTKNFNITQCIDKYGEGDTLKFRYRYCAESAQDSSTFVTITVDYAELSTNAAHNIFKQSTLELRSQSFNIGTVPEAKNGKILIIGNSFISTSNIGEILTEMMQKNGKNTQVEAISRGMATVATYVNDSSLMSKIERGTYKAVFACGLYDSREEINNLKTLKASCDRSNTTLVIFPAHNETTSIVNVAKQRLSSVLMLNWQQEINDLINDNRDKWDFCIDDTYDHSTPPAGYVGAHMIYRAIHGEMPTARLSASIKQSQVNSILGEYVTTGCAKGAMYTLK